MVASKNLGSPKHSQNVGMSSSGKKSPTFTERLTHGMVTEICQRFVSGGPVRSSLGEWTKTSYLSAASSGFNLNRSRTRHSKMIEFASSHCP